MQTRYNSFIPEPTKAGYFSCPSCYVLTKASALSTDIQCSRCGITAPIFTGGTSPATPTAVTVSTTNEFIVTAISIDNKSQVLRCPNCKNAQYSPIGAYSATCSNCGATYGVSYREVCNACLVATTPVFKKAEYICSNPKVNHTAGHNSKLAVSGKCLPHKCSKTCVKV